MLPAGAPIWLELLLRVVVILLFITVAVLALTYLERKVLGRIQRRVGPMRTGPLGLLQPLADAAKLLLKEDLVPGATDRLIYWAAPLVVFVPGFVVWVSIPFTRNLVVRNLDLGLFYIVAVSGLSIVGMVMAGWGSSNKYSFLGGLRAAAQLISYELPLVIGLLGVVMLAQSLDLTVIVDNQQPVPYLLLQPVAFVIFLLAGLAEVGRSPFDIPLAESEVVGGPMVEYSGIHWSMFFLAEYANTLAVAALTALLFLGGWNWPLLPGWLWVLVKTLFVILVIFYIRASVPRFRIDQLMSFAWKFLLPLTFVNLLATAFLVFYGAPKWSLTLVSLAMLAGAGYVIVWRNRAILRGAPKVRLVRGRVPGEGPA